MPAFHVLPCSLLCSTSSVLRHPSAYEARNISVWGQMPLKPLKIAGLMKFLHTPSLTLASSQKQEALGFSLQSLIHASTSLGLSARLAALAARQANRWKTLTLLFCSSKSCLALLMASGTLPAAIGARASILQPVMPGLRLACRAEVESGNLSVLCRLAHSAVR